MALGTCQLSLVVFVGWFRLELRAAFAFLEWAIAFLDGRVLPVRSDHRFSMCRITVVNVIM